MRVLLPVVIAATLLGHHAHAADGPIAVPLDGPPLAARLVRIEPNGQITLAAGDRQQTLALADLAWWGTAAEPARGPLVLLGDGSILVADITGVDKETLALESNLLGEGKAPLEALAGVVYRPPADRQQRDLLLDRVVRAKGESDRVLLDNGDELTGLIEAIDGRHVRLKTAGGPMDLEARRTAAVVFNPALRRAATAPPQRTWVGLADGSRALVSRLALAGSSAELTLAAGPIWKTAAKEIVFLQPLGNRAVYLSDLKPAEYKHVPYLELAWPYAADRNVTGSLLRCGGRLWLKGLGVHSTARLTYTLDQPYRQFQADVGIDDSTGGRGSVGFRVFVDGKLRYTSPPVRGGDAPLPVAVDLSGAKKLDLVVDFGERGDLLDHADWLGARLVR